MKHIRTVILTGTLLLGSFISIQAQSTATGKTSFLNVSFGYSKGFFEEYNPIFAAKWKEQSGQDITFEQSHGASGIQSKKVSDGELAADVVTLAAPPDIDRLHPNGSLLPADWAAKYENNSSPYSTVIVLVTRQGNPKNIHDWSDLAADGVTVLTSNPKICGGGRWNYLAPFGFALTKNGGDAALAEAFVDKIYQNVPVCYKNVGPAVDAFLSGVGDVLITYENVILDKLQKDPAITAEVVYPSLTAEVELPVAVVEANAEKHGTLDAARAYLAGLYEPETQRLFAKYNFRPANPVIAAELSSQFKPVHTFKVQNVFTSWQAAQDSQFAEHGVFEKIYKGELLF